MGHHPVQVCLVGCGKWAACHAAMLRKMPRKVVFSFSSRDLGKAEEYCRRFGGSKAYNGLHAVLEDPDVDAVLLWTPPSNHMEEVEMAAKAGKAICVEKPLARCVEEGRKIITICRDHGVLLLVGENFHYSPPVRLAKDIINSGAIGKVLTIKAKGASNTIWSEWRKDLDTAGGGVLLDEGIHYLYVLRSWAGNPIRFKHVSLQKLASRSVEDIAEIELVMDRAANVSLSLSRGTGEEHISPWFHVIGDEGSLTLDYGASFLRVEGKKRSIRFIGTPSGLLARVFEKDRFGRKAILQDFVSSIKRGGVPQMNGEEGLHDLEFVMAAYEHARVSKGQLAGNPTT